MRLLAATVSALLISVSQPALAQEQHGGLPQDAWQQGEPNRVWPSRAAEMQQPDAPARDAASRGERLGDAAASAEQRDSAAQCLSLRPSKPVPQPAMPSPDEQVEMQPPASRAADEQTEMQPPAMPEPQTRKPRRSSRNAAAEIQADIQDVELPRDAKWTVFFEPSLGTRIDFPSAVLSMPDGPAYRGVGRQFKSADGRAAVAIYSQRNNQGDTPARYLRKNFLFPRAAVTYERVTRDFFAVSGVREDKIFYSRCNVSPTGGTLHCFDLQFPARERAAWDAIVTRMSRSLRPLNRS